MRLSRSRAAEGGDAARARLQRLIAKPFAHRGRHGGGVPENSRAAFEAAVAAGHGVELDVQAGADGRLCVFHDFDLDRLTDRTGPVSRLALAELVSLRLRGSAETIPSLEEALALVGGRVPLLIEIKTRRAAVAALCRAVAGLLAGYHGDVGVMSYHPGVSRWFRRLGGSAVPGLVMRETGPGAVRTALLRRIVLRRARPLFLAYHFLDLPSRFAAAQRARGMPLLTWTCRSEADRAKAARWADQIIYEEGP